MQQKITREREKKKAYTGAERIVMLRRGTVTRRKKLKRKGQNKVRRGRVRNVKRMKELRKNEWKIEGKDSRRKA